MGRELPWSDVVQTGTWNQEIRAPALALPPTAAVTQGKLPFSASYSDFPVRWLGPNRYH